MPQRCRSALLGAAEPQVRWAAAEALRVRITPDEYKGIDLRAHSLLADVPLHDVWVVDLPGGDPLDRDVEKVKEDALNEYISVKKAREVYGVIIDPVTFDVDYHGTEKLRNRKKRAKTKRAK